MFRAGHSQFTDPNPNAIHAQENMDSPGFEPGTLRMRSGCDTTTPQTLGHVCVRTLQLGQGQGTLFFRITYILPPGIEPGTFCVLGRCDNHYTTVTWTRSVVGML